MKCPTCGHDPDDIQQKRAAQSRWSNMTAKEKSAEMSRIRRKGIKKPKRIARRSNNEVSHSRPTEDSRTESRVPGRLLARPHCSTIQHE